MIGGANAQKAARVASFATGQKKSYNAFIEEMKEEALTEYLRYLHRAIILEKIYRSFPAACTEI